MWREYRNPLGSTKDPTQTGTQALLCWRLGKKSQHFKKPAITGLVDNKEEKLGTCKQLYTPGHKAGVCHTTKLRGLRLHEPSSQPAALHWPPLRMLSFWASSTLFQTHPQHPSHKWSPPAALSFPWNCPHDHYREFLPVSLGSCPGTGPLPIRHSRMIFHFSLFAACSLLFPHTVPSYKADPPSWDMQDSTNTIIKRSPPLPFSLRPSGNFSGPLPCGLAGPPHAPALCLFIWRSAPRSSIGDP